MKVPVKSESQRIAKQENMKKKARLKESALYRFSELSRINLVEPGDRKAIDAKKKRKLGAPGPLLSSIGKFAIKEN